MSTQTDRLIRIMARLRDRETGCPWDIEQNFDTIAPYTIEEAYEVADAIAQKDMAALKEELGDLLLQVVYHAHMAQEEAHFDFEDVAETIADKMIRRHPHVFGTGSVESAEAQTAGWEAQKASERQRKAEATGAAASALDGVPLALPALMRAEKLAKRAARIGFDWSETEQVFDKLAEETGELREVIAAGGDRDRLEDELGDLLFCVANLGRHLKLDPETALRRANAKFASRFRRMERSFVEQDRDIGDSTLDEMEARWQQSKRPDD